MAGLPRLYEEGLTEDAALRVAYESFYLGEMSALLYQAERIVSEHPSLAAGADFLTIGSAHIDLGNYDRAISLMEETERRALEADDYVTAIASRRALATAHFRLGAVEEGRAAFERARAIDGFEVPDPVRDGNAVVTMRYWTIAEFEAGNCDAVAGLVEDLRALDTFTYRGLRDELVTVTESQLASC